jgi:hypothetical protein
MLVLAFSASLTCAPADAAPSLDWSAPVQFDTTGAPTTGISCASESLCVAVDAQGHAFASADPTAPAPSWSEAEPENGETLNAVSCAPGGLCVAVGGHGRAFASLAPGHVAWSQASVPNGGKPLTGVSCPTATLCVAVDEEGDVFTSASPVSGGWTLASSRPGHQLTAVSCASPTLCVAVDRGGNVLSSVNPAGATSWSVEEVDTGEPLGASCWAAGACVAVDGGGDALASADPTTPEATWSLTPVGVEAPTAISCAPSGVCVGVDANGGAFASDAPVGSEPSWVHSHAGAEPLTGVSCLPGGFCMALETGGSAIAARVPAPQATTLAPTEVTATGAMLAGVVDPEDAVLGACTFEYGAGSASGFYGRSLPCAVLPAAVGGVQGVSAQLTELAPNSAYDYRVRASSPQGIAMGANETFTTPTSSQVALVHPSPSITGTPANGQTLTCHPGLPTGASAQLTYTWLRDQIPIAGAISSTYGVKGQDTGHHLQCQVTATDGGGSVTAKSSFVTIPVGGAPVSAGETSIGAAVFRNGRLSVPVYCSKLASSSCRVSMRLSAVEALSGRHVVAVSARASRSADVRRASLRHVTVTLASERAHVAPGVRTTVTATLTTAGKRLLASAHRFAAALRVTGTVLGVIEAQLAQQLLTLSAPPHSASTHAARRR